MGYAGQRAPTMLLMQPRSKHTELCHQRFSLVSLPASLRGMWDRTVIIGSAGKTFSATGWKVNSPVWHLMFSPSLSLCSRARVPWRWGHCCRTLSFEPQGLKVPKLLYNSSVWKYNEASTDKQRGGQAGTQKFTTFLLLS